MALNFPDPNLTEEYTSDDGVLYIWDGEKWITDGVPAQKGEKGAIDARPSVASAARIAPSERRSLSPESESPSAARRPRRRGTRPRASPSALAGDAPRIGSHRARRLRRASRPSRVATPPRRPVASRGASSRVPRGDERDSSRVPSARPISPSPPPSPSLRRPPARPRTGRRSASKRSSARRSSGRRGRLRSARTRPRPRRFED